MDLVWVPHPELVWVPGLSKAPNADPVVFDCEGVGPVKVPKAKATGLLPVHDDQLKGVENICNLGEVTEGAVLTTVKVRYARQEIYTRVARILIATNPFCSVPIYGSQFVCQYAGATDSLQEPPHVFGVGSDVLKGMRESSSSQAVLVSGESGAGKTETTKLILSFITEAIKTGSAGVQDRILSTNPVLESFGNAMTVRNNNSSRFGKWLEIVMSDKLEIKQCTVTDYLLELTRVINQGASERNYHIFFQLIAGRDNDLLKDLGIEGPSKYRYLQNCRPVAPGIDDKAEFGELTSAFACLGLNTDLQKDIFRLVFAVLVLGNCDFADEGDTAKLVDDAPMKRAAELLQLNPDSLQKCFLTRKISVGSEVTETPLKGPQARAARDAFARLLYGRTFKWLIAKINSVLSHTDGAVKGKWFGVLDIAGFESFDHNSLEQLFINLGNEKLQAQFNGYVFQNELADYKAEGVNLDTDIKFQDNSDILSLLEGRGGILSLLDEEVFVPKSTDMTFVSKVTKSHDKHPRFVVPKMGGKPVFGVQHFAGIVMYSCEGFLEKNVDKPPDETVVLLSSSTTVILNEIADSIKADDFETSPKSSTMTMTASRSRAAKGRNTVAVNFKASLRKLMDKLEISSPHFIRCVKPNAEKLPYKFTPKMGMEQLLFSGVMEAVKIRQAGYSARLLFSEFFGRYRLLVPKRERGVFNKVEGELEKTKLLISMLPKILNQNICSEHLVLGKRKVFAKSAVMRALEEKRPIVFAGAVVEVQRMFRGYRVRKTMLAGKKLTEWIKKHKLYHAAGPASAFALFKSVTKLQAALDEFDELIMDSERGGSRTPVVGQAIKVRNRMEQEVLTLQKLQELTTSVDVTEIDKALARAEDLKLPKTGDFQTLKQRSAKLEVQYPLKEAMEKAIKNEDLEQLKDCMNELRKRGLYSDPTQWLPGLDGEALATRVFDTIERTKTKIKQNGLRTEQKEQAQAAVFGTAAVGDSAVDATKANAFTIEAPRKTKKTITGMTGEEQMHTLLQLQVAATEYNCDTMDELLRQATRNGMGKEELSDFRELFAQLQSEDFLYEKIAECEELVKGDDVQETSIKQLKNLAKQLDIVAGDELVVADARKAILRSIKHRASLAGRKSVFDCSETERACQGTGGDDELAIDIFDLANYPNLKRHFRGHRGNLMGKVMGKSGRGDANAMISHTCDELKEGLTMLPPALESQAVQTFRDILGWMNDKPIVECRRLSYSHDIVAVAKKSPPLKDEIFCQVMKQLTNNSSDRSVLLGWKLLLKLCQEVIPSTDLSEFVRAFIIKNMRAFRPTGGEILAVARQCHSDFNKQAKADEDYEMGMIDVCVTLIDHSTRKVRMHETATLIDLGQALATQMRLQRFQDFSFFQLIEDPSGTAEANTSSRRSSSSRRTGPALGFRRRDQAQGVEVQRLLPMKTTLMGLFEKWTIFKERTHKESRLLLKRVFMDKTEVLMPRCLLHATLTYRQVLWDYLHYPIYEDKDLMLKIAAALLIAEPSRNLGTEDLSGEGLLEQVIPDHLLKFDKDRRKWSKAIFQKLAELQADLESSEPRLEKMSRLLHFCQGMKMFGSLHWYVKQVKPPDDQSALENFPKTNVSINEKAPGGEYWIMVTRKGIGFVPYDGAPGEEFQKTYMFDIEAMDRIVRWGYQQDLLQLVVMTVDRDNPAAGMVEFGISCRSPSALDIAFAIQVAKGSRQL